MNTRKTWIRAVSCLLAAVLLQWNGMSSLVFAQSGEPESGENADARWIDRASTRNGVEIKNLARVARAPSRPAVAHDDPEENDTPYLKSNPVSVVVVFGVMFAGYLALYVPVGSWGAIQCTVAAEGWNDCWNTYMNRTFH